METHADREAAAHAHRLPTAAAIARHLGGTLCTIWHPGCSYTRTLTILLPGALYVLQLSTVWRERDRFTANLYLTPTDAAPQGRNVYRRESSPTYSWSRDPAALAADIRRRSIDAQHAAAVQAHADHIAHQRARAAEAAALEHLARLFEVPGFDNYNGSHHANGIRFSDYSFRDYVHKSAPLRAEVTIAAPAVPLLAPLVTASRAIPANA